MSSTESDYFEIATDKALFKKDGAAPFGAPAGTRVESFKETGDWVDIHLSSGYQISLHESRIAYILTRNAA
jgi:hypothetical protein